MELFNHVFGLWMNRSGDVSHVEEGGIVEPKRGSKLGTTIRGEGVMWEGLGRGEEGGEKRVWTSDFWQQTHWWERLLTSLAMWAQAKRKERRRLLL
jgi:hypothetical protein